MADVLRFVPGDLVVWMSDNAPHKVTKSLPGRVQLDGKTWVRNIDELIPTAVIPDKPRADHSRKKRLPSWEYIEIMAGLGYTFSMSALDNRIHVNAEPIDDPLAETIKTDMRDLGHVCSNVIESAWIKEARSNLFHPIKDYLDALEWDKQDHIGNMTMHFSDVDNAFPVFFRKWIIGAVAKVYQRAQNPMLVLDGAQNIGKSYFARWLCSSRAKFFIEAPIRPDNKDDLLQLATAWIWEVGEMGSTMRKADREALKHFLTMRDVTVRPPYGKYSMNKPALASFIGTLNNESGFLNDPTGSRRFLSVSITDIDQAYAEKINPDQIWAQALTLYRSGEGWTLSESASEMSKVINGRYEVEDPLESLIPMIFDIDSTKTEDEYWQLPTSTILGHLHAAGWHMSFPRGESMAVAAVLKRLGAKKPDNKIKDPKTSKQVRGYSGIRLYQSSQNQPFNQP
jgi:hypothetical protein